MLGSRNDLDIFETSGLHAIGNELRGALHIRDMLGQGADAGDAKESLELVQEARFILLYEEVSGLRHTLL